MWLSANGIMTDEPVSIRHLVIAILGGRSGVSAEHEQQELAVEPRFGARRFVEPRHEIIDALEA